MKSVYTYQEHSKVWDISEQMIRDVFEMVALGAASVAFGYLIHILLF